MSDSQAVRIRVFGRTDVGRQRQNNEDNFVIGDLTQRHTSLSPENRTQVVGPKGALLMVADGMGGANAGEVASQMAVEIVFNDLLRTWSDDPSATEELFADRLHDSIRNTNREIRNHGLADESKRGMGATCVAAVISGTHAYFCNVGDSRGYLLRGNECTQVTHDQSFVQHLLDAGAITPEQAARSPRRNVVMEALGARDEINVGTVAPIELRHGDIFVLCSDGLTGHLSATDIMHVVYHSDDPTERCKLLVGLANDRGGSDNVTAIVAEIEFEGQPAVVRTSPGVPPVVVESPQSQDQFPQTPPSPPQMGQPAYDHTASYGDPGDRGLDASFEVQLIKTRTQSLMLGFGVGLAVGLGMVGFFVDRLLGHHTAVIESHIQQALQQLPATPLPNPGGWPPGAGSSYGPEPAPQPLNPDDVPGGYPSGQAPRDGTGAEDPSLGFRTFPTPAAPVPTAPVPEASPYHDASPWPPPTSLPSMPPAAASAVPGSPVPPAATPAAGEEPAHPEAPSIAPSRGPAASADAPTAPTNGPSQAPGPSSAATHPRPGSSPSVAESVDTTSPDPDGSESPAPASSSSPTQIR